MTPTPTPHPSELEQADVIPFPKRPVIRSQYSGLASRAGRETAAIMCDFYKAAVLRLTLE
jgi:hypothetical protein